jgi:hypothetical protein
MFWYRPAALNPLLNMAISDDEVPDEPLPSDTDILHVLERLMVYVAWSEGYDYRVMAPETPYLTNFSECVLMHRQAWFSSRHPIVAKWLVPPGVYQLLSRTKRALGVSLSQFHHRRRIRRKGDAPHSLF